MSSKKVIVIGAGLGGLSAAISLKQSGYDVEVFEKNAQDRRQAQRAQGARLHLRPRAVHPHAAAHLRAVVRAQRQEDERLLLHPRAAPALAEFLRGRQGGGLVSRTGEDGRRGAQSRRTAGEHRALPQILRRPLRPDERRLFRAGLGQLAGICQALRLVQVFPVRSLSHDAPRRGVASADALLPRHL